MKSIHAYSKFFMHHETNYPPDVKYHPWVLTCLKARVKDITSSLIA